MHTRLFRPRPLLLLLLLLLLGPAGVALAQPSPGSRLKLFRDQHTRMRQEYLASLATLEKWCLDRGLDQAARQIHAAGGPARGELLLELALPTTVTPALSPNLPADQRHWQSQWRTLRKRHAIALFLLSRRVIKAGQTSYAYDLVRETVACDPDSTAGRRLLGFVRFSNDWVTPFAASQRRKRQVWHPIFGWLPAAHVERYQKGQRYFKRKWVSASREKQLRRDFQKNAWELRTDHYLVKTNHSLERGVALAVALEKFHRFFHASFAGFFKTPEQMQRLFAGNAPTGQPRIAPRPHVVHYYRERDEYRRTLRPRIQQIDITNGLYMPDDRIVYFYHGVPPDKNFPQATLFHEATHQLFYESRPHQRPIARQAHFWIVEGIACYMESFKPTDKGYTIGDPNYVRFYWARRRLLQERYYIPLKVMAGMGMRVFQTDPNIARNYSQASGLAHFFLHYDGGVYRDALIQHLLQIYTPGQRAVIDTLPTLTRVDTAVLDRQYRSYLNAQQKSLAPAPAPARTPRQ